jgi:HK97 gp10 family phage protein
VGRVKVVRNEFPEIIRDLPDAVDKGAKETADHMASVVADRVWHLLGFVEQASVDRPSTKGALYEVVCGFNRGMGFYSRFNEWGTVKQAARPIVGPTAHEFEPEYARVMSRFVRQACRG